METEEREKELREALDAQWEIPKMEKFRWQVWWIWRVSGFLFSYIIYIPASGHPSAKMQTANLLHVVKPGNVSGHIFTGRPHHDHCFSLAESFEKGHNISDLWMIMTGWWFGTWILFFHILGFSSSQVTNSIIFQRGRSTTNQNVFPWFSTSPLEIAGARRPRNFNKGWSTVTTLSWRRRDWRDWRNWRDWFLGIFEIMISLQWECVYVKIWWFPKMEVTAYHPCQ